MPKLSYAKRRGTGKLSELESEFPQWRMWMQVCTRPFVENYLEAQPDATEEDALRAMNSATWVLLSEMAKGRLEQKVKAWQAQA